MTRFRSSRGKSPRPAAEPVRPRRLKVAGHLIDSGLMSRCLDVVVENGGACDLHRFDIGRTVHDFSTAGFSMTAPDPQRLDRNVGNLTTFGCHLADELAPRG